MQSIPHITQLQNAIKSISLNLFKIESQLNVVELLSTIPSSVISILTNPELIELADKTSELVIKLNDILNPVNRALHKALYQEKQSNQNHDEPYAGFKVDEKPILGSAIKEESDKQISIFDFEAIKSQYELENNKTLKPVNRKSSIPYKGDCVFCGAPNEYLYNNNNGNQCRCKACKNTFNVTTRKYDELGYYCPHCKNKLELYHDRKQFLVLRCRNDRCNYYQEALKKQSANDESLKTVSGSDKLRYSYRSFKFTKDELNDGKIHFDTTIKLENAHHSPQTIGTILTLYVNYGLSSRKVAMLMKDLFNIKISHQTVMNYAEASASYLQNFIIKYNYSLGNILCGDETYIKVLGKSKYVFFFSDPVKKIITSWKIYDHRDTRNAVESLLMSFNKYDKLPEDLLVITDANPIYNAAQIFLSMNDINFNLQQVVGVTNKDEISVKYRPYKQIEERLNRTYKQNYHGTNGYQTLKSANIYMILYVTFFNFLRRHSSLDYKTPVEIKELDDCLLMSDKWISLINMSKSYIN